MMKIRLQIGMFAGLMSILLTGCMVLEPTTSAPIADSDSTGPYRLQIGDSLMVKIQGSRTDDEIKDIIDENGDITMPYLGRIFAAGKTSSELEEAIQRAYVSEQIYNDIDITVLISGRDYYVRGEVRNPGKFSLLGGQINLSQALAEAGGYTDFARLSRVRIIRGNRTFRINMRELENDPDKNVIIEAGDLIVVPRKPF